METLKVRLIEPFIHIIQGEYQTVDIVTVIGTALLMIASFWLIFSIMGYIRTYRIIEQWVAKITGDILTYDRIKRSQLKKQLEENSDAFSRVDKKIPIMNKLYITIAQTGIVERIPGFSEAAFIGVMVIIGIILFIVFSLLRNLMVGITISVSFLMVIWYITDLLAYNRKIKLENQLLQFTDACASASLQYSSLIDIFGAIYDQFQYPLREGLEACYVEAKSTNNKDMALKHLKEKYDSIQFSFVIDNLELCNAITGDYHSAARDISNTVSLYNESHEKKVAALKTTKGEIIIMFIAVCAILIAMSSFLGGIWGYLFNTTIGNIMMIALLLVFFYGLNIKTER